MNPYPNLFFIKPNYFLLIFFPLSSSFSLYPAYHNMNEISINLSDLTSITL